MRFTLLRKIIGAFTLLGTACAAWPAYPDHPIRIIVPAQPGGSVDTLGRVLAAQLQTLSGVPVYVTNRGGAGGTIAVRELTQAPKDGYTLLISPPDAVVVAPHVNGSVRYEAMRDLAPVAMIGTTHYSVAVRADSPYKTLQQLMAAAKERKSAIKYASSGQGTSTHLFAANLQDYFHSEFLTVHYKGAGPAALALVSGEADVSVNSPATFKPFLDSGQLRLLAVAAPQRLAALPDTPTFAELGVKTVPLTAWFGLFTTTGVKASALEELGKLIETATSSTSFEAKIKSLHFVPQYMNHTEFRKLVQRDDDNWKNVVNQSTRSLLD